MRGYSLLGVWCISKHGENKAVRNVKGGRVKKGGAREGNVEGGLGWWEVGGRRGQGPLSLSPRLYKRERKRQTSEVEGYRI